MVFIEWFPLLAKREVLNCWFGTEWDPADNRVITRFNIIVSRSGLGRLPEAVVRAFGARDFLVLTTPNCMDDRGPIVNRIEGYTPDGLDDRFRVFQNESMEVYRYRIETETP